MNGFTSHLINLLPTFLLGTAAFSASITSSGIVEDFSSLDYADLTTTTGVWNTVDQHARPRAFADGANTATRPIDFGNGSDGVLNSSAGYNFNTTTHPTGFNFISVNITGGAITVTGTNPLIIRSLTSVNITPTLSVNGPNGGDGDLSGVVTTGPTAVTCQANGGNGGSATLATGNNGADGFISSGASTGSGYFGIGDSVTATIDANANADAPHASNDFETASNFVCGHGAAGGGGFTDTTNFASGAAGGAGGGVIKIVAVGDITLGAIEAKGGNGGNGIAVGANCSGSGAGGAGGVIFLQSLKSIVAAPSVLPGTGGFSPCNGGTGPSVSDGKVRGDMNSVVARPAWAIDPVTTGTVTYDTDIVPASQVSVIQSKAYDLGAFEVTFGTPSVSTTGVGTVAMTYAGSVDNVIYSAFTSDLSTLNGLSYRYLKWRASITNAGVAGAPLQITKVTIPLSIITPPEVKVKLSYGCGLMSLIAQDGKSNSDQDKAGVVTTVFWLLIFALICLGAKRIQVTSS